MKKFARAVSAAVLVVVLQGSVPYLGGISAVHAQSQPDATVSEAAMVKMSAFVDFLNQTIRTSESLQRYESWVDMKKGPTGKESRVAGLYSLYDVRELADKALASAQTEPKLPELDAAMTAYIKTYQQLAPVIERAYKYYERQDYKSDKMAGGKAFHKDIAALAPVYQGRRKTADAALRTEKVTLDTATLLALEKAEGKKSRWHVRNVMFRAEAVMDFMPTNEKPVVAMPEFKQVLDEYAQAVRDFDDYALEHPNSFHVFESAPASLLSKLRNFDEKLDEAKGDARRGAGEDLRWLISDYNTMVSTSESATVFAKD